MDKLKLIILAIAISVPVCSSLIWALMSVTILFSALTRMFPKPTFAP